MFGDITYAHAVIVNCGNTPALNVTVAKYLKVIDGEMTDEIFPIVTYGKGFVLHPGKSLTLKFEEHIDKRTRKELKDGTADAIGRKLFAFGFISYYDCFDVPHYTRFCFHIKWNPMQKGDEIPGWNIQPKYSDTDDKPIKQS